MMRWMLSALVVLTSCTKAGPTHETPAPETTASPAFAPAPPSSPPKATTVVELTAVTLADDCGGAPPWSPPAAPAQKREEKADSMQGARSMKAKRRCEQTSMQLAIAAGTASNIHVKSVELFGADGASLGKLAASKPTRWNDASSTYETWDETVAAGATSSVSYVLEQPKWDQIGDRWNRMYTLKAILTIDGVDRATQKDITLSAPTSLPPNVKT